MIFRLGMEAAGKIASSFDGVRQSAVHWRPAARLLLRAARPTPPLAPKKATVLVLEVMVLQLICGWYRDQFQDERFLERR